MHELKRLSKEAIPAALEKAEHYRLLNEAMGAESICRDVLEVEPENQLALVTLLLALSDQFEARLSTAFPEARGALARVSDEYSRHYYDGILCERRAKAHWSRSNPGRGALAHGWFHQAMAAFERAMAISPGGNDDAILRWNTCARILNANPEIAPRPGALEAELLE